MDARKRISAALQASVFGPEHAEDLARELYDFVAHELAEEIRNAPFEPHLLQRHQRYRAAAIIDPKKEG